MIWTDIAIRSLAIFSTAIAAVRCILRVDTVSIALMAAAACLLAHSGVLVSGAGNHLEDVLRECCKLLPC